jgi:hypothetical protein
VRPFLKKIVALGKPRRLTPNDIRLPGDVNRNPAPKRLPLPGMGGLALPIAAGSSMLWPIGFDIAYSQEFEMASAEMTT